jgi:gluconolactonase
MAWNFELVAGPCKGRTGGLAWDGAGMLFSAVAEERILRYDPASGKTGVFRKWTGRTNGIAIAKDGTVFGAQEGGRRVIHFLADGSTAPTQELLDGAHHNQPVDVVVDGRGRVWLTRFSRTRRCCAWTAAAPACGASPVSRMTRSDRAR